MSILMRHCCWSSFCKKSIAIFAFYLSHYVQTHPFTDSRSYPKKVQQLSMISVSENAEYINSSATSQSIKRQTSPTPTHLSSDPPHQPAALWPRPTAGCLCGHGGNGSQSPAATWSTLHSSWRWHTVKRKKDTRYKDTRWALEFDWKERNINRMMNEKFLLWEANTKEKKIHR